MAVAPICFKMCYKDQTRMRGCFMHRTVNKDVPSCISADFSYTGRRDRDFYNSAGILMKADTSECINVSRRLTRNTDSISFSFMREVSVSSRVPISMIHIRSIFGNASEKEKVSRVRCALESSSTEQQLSSLDSYFGKLQNDAGQPASSSLNNDRGLHNRGSRSTEEKDLESAGDYFGKVFDESGQFKARRERASIDNYLVKVNKDGKSKGLVSSTSCEDPTEATPHTVKEVYGSRLKVQNKYMASKKKDGPSGLKCESDETSDLYIISTMASINIAVYLFEIASPIRNSDLELFSLPSLYGAKINHLILIGEWWRLVTPMFLHSGILHVGLGCWALLTFGPQVCKAYGPFTFFLIYILGGLSGNLTSFLHTPDPTVGGTGPVFAIIGAWLIYQYQNKDAIEKEASESLFQKAIVATALGFILSTFGPIDDWTHFGSAFTGIAYGFFTCPTLQMDDPSSSSENRQEEGITLVRRNVDPCKSLLFFSIFIAVLSSLLFIVEPPLNSLVIDNLV